MIDFLKELPSYFTIAVVFVVMLSILVAAHELGHYLFARLFGMGVEEFAIGFGKKPLWTWMRRTYKVRDDHHVEEGEKTETTDFTIRPWPLGGFVRIKGMMPEEDGSEVNIPGGFYNKSPFQRFIVLLAGPAFSVLAGILILIPLYTTVGIDRRVNDPVIYKVTPGGHADKVGIKAGDRILVANGQTVNTFYDFLTTVRANPDKQIGLTVERDGARKEFTVTPALAEYDTMVVDKNLEPTGEFKRQAVIGIEMNRESKLVQLPLGAAVVAAFNEPVRAVRSVSSLLQRPKNFDKTVAGPITMVAATNEALKEGIARLIVLSALISISVGIFNLLPFAPLDGGQMVVAVVEMLRGGKRLSIQMQSAISAVGMALILALVLGTWFVDFKRWFGADEAPATPPAKTQPAK